MAELFWWFEVVKPSFVKPRLLDDEGTGMSLIMALSKCLLYQWKLCIKDTVLSKATIWMFECSFLRHTLIICHCGVTSEPSSLLKNMPVIPISKATKRSFMERPPSPERPRYGRPIVDFSFLTKHDLMLKRTVVLHYIQSSSFCLCYCLVCPSDPSLETQVTFMFYPHLPLSKIEAYEN